MKLQSLSDSDFIELYLKILKTNPPARSFVLVDLDFNTLYANQTFLEFIEMSLEEIQGKRMRDWKSSFLTPISAHTRLLTEKALKQDQYVRSIIEVIKNDTTHYIDCYYIKVINPFTKNVIGVISNLNWARFSNPLLNIIKALHRKMVIINEEATSFEKTAIDLTPIEHEITTLLVIGKSYKEVAAILSEIHDQQYIPATISTITYRKIFPKFNVNSLSGLIMRATSLKILESIPKSFLS